MDKSTSLLTRYQILAALFLMIIFILGTISTMHHFIESTPDLLEIVHDGEKDIEVDHLSFGDPENDETQILIFDDKYLLSLIMNEFNDRDFQFTAHLLQVVTPPPELI